VSSTCGIFISPSNIRQSKERNTALEDVFLNILWHRNTQRFNFVVSLIPLS
jgi:hypothetical protein